MEEPLQPAASHAPLLPEVKQDLSAMVLQASLRRRVASREVADEIAKRGIVLVRDRDGALDALRQQSGETLRVTLVDKDDGTGDAVGVEWPGDAVRLTDKSSDQEIAAAIGKIQQADEEEGNGEDINGNGPGNQDLLLTNGNSHFPSSDVVYHYSSVLQQRQDRKSSGYSSLEGENSSLDSGNGNGEETGVYGYPRADYRTLGNYAVPESYAQLDEITLLKMEIGRHPDILNKNY